MRGSSRLLAVAVILVVAIAAVLGFYLWRQWQATRPLPPPQAPVELPDSFTIDDVPVQSPDLELHLVGMRGTVHPDYTDWACLLECREREGCHATVEVRVEYRSATWARRRAALRTVLRMPMPTTFGCSCWSAARRSTGMPRCVSARERTKRILRGGFQSNAPIFCRAPTR